jgi:DNA-binding transcriptional LysR family regulator
MQPRFTLRQLAYFIAVVEAGTLRAAAERLNLSQSALSQGLTEFERDLGATVLIRRRSQGVRLTSVGRDVLEIARATLQNAAALSAQAGGKATTLSGTVAIGCYTTLAPFVIPPLVADLRSRNPDLQVEILDGALDEIVPLMHQGRCEVGFFYNSDVFPGVSYEPLYEVRPHVLLPAKHRLAKLNKVDLRDLVDEPLILFDAQPARRNSQLVFDGVGVVPNNIVARVSNFELVRSLVGRGLGYSVMIQRPPINRSYEGYAVVERGIARSTYAMSVSMAYFPQYARSRAFQEIRKSAAALRKHFSGEASAPAKGAVPHGRRRT